MTPFGIFVIRMFCAGPSNKDIIQKYNHSYAVLGILRYPKRSPIVQSVFDIYDHEGPALIMYTESGRPREYPNIWTEPIGWRDGKV